MSVEDSDILCGTLASWVMNLYGFLGGYQHFGETRLP